MVCFRPHRFLVASRNRLERQRGLPNDVILQALIRSPTAAPGWASTVCFETQLHRIDDDY